MGKNTTIIDCQIFQTGSYHRGMGKYSFELLRAFFQNDEFINKEAIFLFNSKLPVNQDIEDLINTNCNAKQIVYLALETPKEPRTRHSIQPVRLKNRQLIDSYIRSGQDFSRNNNVSFLILALYLDEVCPVFPSEDYAKRTLLYYDSIPYLYHERYGQFKGFFDHFYLPHTASVYDADLILTISNTVANDLHIFFGIDKSKIKNIDGALIPHSFTTKTKPHQVNKKFILMPSGQELRKNNARAIQAFQNYIVTTGNDINLVVTSHFTNEAVAELKSISPNVIFTGNVPPEELAWLYEKCEFVIFPSEYEGLGLPILEAVNEGKPVMCSDIPVFREISKEAFYMFDPLDDQDITRSFIEMDSTATSAKKTLHYKDIRKKYTWARTASLSISSMKQLVHHKESTPRKRVAILCPEPSGFSAIGKVVVESHAMYSKYFDIDYYFDKGPSHRTVRPNLLAYVTYCGAAEDFGEDLYRKYDAVIYHIGNSEYHLEIIRASLVLPGIVILHDTQLAGAFKNLVLQGIISDSRYKLEQRLNEKNSSNSSSFLSSIVNTQKAVVVHSDFARKAIDEILVLEKKPIVTKINLPVSTPLDVTLYKKNSKKRLTIALAGIIASVKGVSIIEELANDAYFNDCNISIFGFSFNEPSEMMRLRSMPNVNIVTNPSDFRFQTEMAASDVLINVRLEYKGETSLTTLEAMRYGNAVIVRSFGWYDELPNKSVCKVKSPADVTKALRVLVEDESKRVNLSKNALATIGEQFTHQQYAHGMYKIVDLL